MSLPASYKLRTLLPGELPLAVVSQDKLKALWHHVPWIDDVIGFHGKRFDQSCQAQLSRFCPGATIIFPNSFGAAWDLHQLGLPNLIGRSGQRRSLLIHHLLPRWKRKPGKDKHHEARKYLEFATACGYNGWDCRFPPLKGPCVDPEQDAIEAIVDDRSDILIIAPGAAYGPSKRWPVQYFNQVAQWWSEEGGTVIPVGTSKEAKIAEASIVNCRGASSLAGQTTLPQLMYVLRRAKCVLTNDSGVMHLAAALNCNGIALFGSTEPIATGPIGGRWIVLKQELPCSPCLQRTCYRKDLPYECLRRITPELVIEQISMMLQGDS